MYFCIVVNNILNYSPMYENLIISKSPLFTLKDVHYLCAENEEIKFLLDYQFEKADPFNISDDLPTEIQKQIRELGDSYYTIAIIPHEFVLDFSERLKAHLKEKLEEIVKTQFISDEDLYTNIPDLFQNLAALQVIDKSIKLEDLFSLIKEIDKFAILSSQIFFY